MHRGGSPPLEKEEKEMGKIVVCVAVGVFVGAMVAEIIRKTNPRFLQEMRAKIKNSAKAAKAAFLEGYAGPEAV